MTLAKAPGDRSASKAAISSGVGGRPIKSNVARRMSVRRSGAGDGARPFASNRARINRSIEVRGQLPFLTCGGAGFLTGRKAQCFFQALPVAPVVGTDLVSGQGAPIFTQA